MINPSLREEPLNQRSTPRINRRADSILVWLESEGRLLAREPAAPPTTLLGEEDELFLDDLSEAPEEDFMEDDDIINLDE